MNIDIEYAELAAFMMRMNEAEWETLKTTEDTCTLSEISDKLEEKYNVTLEVFSSLVEALLPMTIPQQSLITKQYNHIMGVHEHGMFRAILEQQPLANLGK